MPLHSEKFFTSLKFNFKLRIWHKNQHFWPFLEENLAKSLDQLAQMANFYLSRQCTLHSSTKTRASIPFVHEKPRKKRCFVFVPVTTDTPIFNTKTLAN